MASDTLFDPVVGAGILLVFAIVMLGLTYLYTSVRMDKDSFIVADRNLPLIKSAMSVTASWIWAPAVFVSAQKAFELGFTGLLWFTFMNTLTIAIFSLVGIRVRRMMPEGYTLPSFMKERFSKRVQYVFLIQFLAVGTVAFAAQLVAGAGAVAFMTGIPFWGITVAMALLTLAYSLYSGLEASVITDWVQMAFILAVAIPVGVGTVFIVKDFGTLIAGGGGFEGGGAANPLSAKGLLILWTFGIPTSITHFSGLVSDQSFWQRNWAVAEENVANAYRIAAAIFIFVPLSLGALGLLAAGQGFQPDSNQLVNIEYVAAVLPRWISIPFAVMLIAGLASTLDSQLNAVGSLVGHDLTADASQAVTRSRIAMVGLTIVGLAIANIPAITIFFLFLTFGAIRASTALITWLVAYDVGLKEKSVFAGTAITLFAIVPAFGYAGSQGMTNLKVTLLLAALFVPGIIAYVGSKIQKEPVENPLADPAPKEPAD